MPPSKNSRLLLGNVALITGGSGTIGRAIAKKLVEHGAFVVLTARNMENLQEAAASIEAATSSVAGSTIQCFPCDTSVEASVVALFKAIDKQQQSINILINNAGINIPGDTIGLSAENFERVMRVNVTGPFLCAREAMKRMQLAKDDAGNPVGGRIINIGSLSALSPRPDSCPYTTSKFALLGLTKSLALDGRNHRIAVSIIHPGNVESDLLTDEMKRERKEIEGFLSPDDVAECVVTIATLPATTNVVEMTVLPTRQPFVGRG